MGFIYQSNFYKKYYAPTVSLSSCVCLILVLFTIITPYFAASSTLGFFNIFSTYTEQPIITYNNELILSVTENDKTMYYTTILELNEYYSNPLPTPVIKITNLDPINVGSISTVNVQVSFPCNPSNIKNVKLLAFFNYILKDKAKIEMKLMAYADINVNYGSSYIFITGDIELKQKTPISYGTVTRSVYNTPIFDNYTSPYDLVSIIQNYNSRNITSNFRFDKIIYPNLFQDQLTIDANFNFPSYQNVWFVFVYLGYLVRL